MKRFVAALVRACLASAIALLTSSATAAVDPQTIRDLAFGNSDDKIKATPWSPYIPEDKGKKDEPEKK